MQGRPYRSTASAGAGRAAAGEGRPGGGGGRALGFRGAARGGAGLHVAVRAQHERDAALAGAERRIAETANGCDPACTRDCAMVQERERRIAHRAIQAKRFC